MIIFRKNIKHIAVAAGMLLCAAGCAFAGAAALTARAEEAAPDASLFLPSSYEQYLELDAPTVAAFSAGHIAIADGETLYIYDRTEGAYSLATLPSDNSVTQLGFAGERLFISTRSASNFFYEYDFETKEFVPYNINFSTFCIEGNTLYTANVGGTSTTIASYSIANLSETRPTATTLGTLDNNATPNMTFLGGELYCAFNHVVFYQNEQGKFDAKSCFFLSNNAADVASVKGVCALEDYFYFTASDGLYRTDTEGNSTLIAEGEGFSALTAFGGKLYMIAGSSIKELAPTEEGAAFTGYEIASASSSVNRLSGAVDTARAGDLLVTADAGNKRISIIVLQQIDQEYTAAYYSTIPCLDCDNCVYTPTLIATDGTIIAVASTGDNPCIYLYHFGEIVFSYCYYLDNPALGIACVNGNCYYITENSYGKVDADFEEIIRPDNKPTALVADECGTLYVVNSEGKVQIYNENTFTNCMIMNGEEVDIEISTPFTSLRVDNEGNLYYINGAALWKNGNQLIGLRDKSFVYADEEEIKAFVFDLERNEIIFLYENYLVKTAYSEIQ